MWIVLLMIIGIILIGVVFINRPEFGKIPEGPRKQRIENSPHYKEGKFQNLSLTPQLTSDKGIVRNMLGFLFRKDENLRPHTAIPVVKTDLWNLDRNAEILIWFGHSSYFLQTNGKRILVDPVFMEASPVSFVNKPFKGTEVYKPEDIPDIDYLVISHDHWDHLDYKTVSKIKDRTRKVVCPLGVGAHFEYWDFPLDQIVELDWYEDAVLDQGFKVYCKPARHFSGRGLSPNQSLWASYVLKTPTITVYIGGDSGYDSHFKEIDQQFEIDLAVLENGQYDNDWKYIHTLPENLARAIQDLNPKKILTVHHSKFALAKHPWKEPLERISKVAEKDSLPLITPRIGEIVYLEQNTQTFDKWWEVID